LTTGLQVSPTARAELAIGYGNHTVLLQRLAKPGDAERECRKALAIWEKLTADFPGVPQYRHERAKRHYSLGGLLTGLNKRAEAEEQYRAAVGFVEPLATDFPAEPIYRQLLAGTHSALADLFRGLGKRPEAEEQYRKATDVGQKLVDEGRATPEFLARFAYDQTNLGGLLFHRGKRHEGEEYMRRALAVREKLAAEFPAATDHQTALGGSASNYGGLLSDSGRPRDALPWLDLAVRTLTAARERDPHSTTARDFLSNSHASRAFTYHRLQQYDEAVRDWDWAIELDPMGRKLWARVARASSKASAGQVSEAVAEADELTKSSDWNAGELCTLAGVYARASGKIAGKKEEHAARAVGLLRAAVKAGFRNTEMLANDEALAPLRDRDDFKKLLADLRKK
jgi:tetratricopeptide (TPR) repeat protein